MLNYFAISCIVFIFVIVIRTIKLSSSNFKPVKKLNILKHVLKMIAGLIKTTFIMYTTSIGVYIIIERMLKYKIYPATEKGVYSNLIVVHNMEPNEFVSRLFLLMLLMYMIFFLPYKLLRLYETVVKENEYTDYLQIICNKSFLKMKKSFKKVQANYKSQEINAKNNSNRGA